LSQSTSDHVLSTEVFHHKGARGASSATRLAIAATLALTLSAGAAWAASGPEVADFKLANGLEVVVLPDHRAPVVTHMIWYKVGAADESPGKSGLAHYLEHLMFKGTEKNPGDAFSQDVAEIGIEVLLGRTRYLRTSSQLFLEQPLNLGNPDIQFF